MARNKLKSVAAAVLIGIGAHTAAGAEALTGVDQLLQYGYITYGDALSVSLPLSAYYYDQNNGGGTGPGNPYYVTSTPGAIKDLVVVATGADGNPVVTNFPGMDNAYPTPNGTENKPYDVDPFFSTRLVADPGGAGEFTGDFGGTWDAKLSTMNTFLAGDAPIFYFNNNQTNSGSAYEQSLAAWARVWVTDASGNIVQLDAGGNVVIAGSGWYFTNNGGAYGVYPNNGGTPAAIDPFAFASFTGSGTDPLAGDNSNTDYVLSGGQICIMPGGTPGPSVPCDTPGSVLFNHNLGANQAAYAVVFPEFNALLAALTAAGTLGDYTLHGDVRLGCDPASFGNTDLSKYPAECIGTEDDGTGNFRYARGLNNGYEQIFIRGVTVENVVPEPNALALAGLGLLASVAAMRRRKQRPA